MEQYIYTQTGGYPMGEGDIICILGHQVEDKFFFLEIKGAGISLLENKNCIFTGFPSAAVRSVVPWTTGPWWGIS